MAQTIIEQDGEYYIIYVMETEEIGGVERSRIIEQVRATEEELEDMKDQADIQATAFQAEATKIQGWLDNLPSS